MSYPSFDIIRKKFCLLSKRQFLLVFLLLSCIFYPLMGVIATPTLEEGKKLLQEEKPKEAKVVLEQVVKAEPKNHEANYLLGFIYALEGDYDKCIKYAKKAVELEGSNSEYHLWLGRCYSVKAMNSSKIKAPFTAKKGKSEFEKAVELDSANLEARFALFQYHLWASGIAGGDKKKAKELAGIIYKMDRFRGAQAWAAFWEDERELDKTETYLREAAELDTSSTFRARYSLGYFFQNNKKYDEAVVVYEEILKKNPKEMGALYQICKTYFLAKDSLEKAEACFKRYLEEEPTKNSPSWAAAHWRLGMVYDLQGKKDLALIELKKAVELEPDNKEFKKTLQEVQKKK